MTIAPLAPVSDERGAWLISLTKPVLWEYLRTLPDDEQILVAHWVETHTPWRHTPATFANHLTDGEWKLWPYTKLLGERFRAAILGEDPHQIWMLPSQYGKTSGLIWGIVWALDQNPRLRIMYVSYDADRAVDEGGKARDIAERYRDRLNFRLRRDQRAKGKWMTTAGGGLYCVGVGGAITGFPQDVVLGDDLIKGWEAAHSEADRTKVWAVYRSQIRMRVQSNRNPILVAGTRWHEDDVAARLMSSAKDPSADQWSVVRLPAIAEPADPTNADPLLRQADPLGRAPGDVLEPERFPLEEVHARRAVLGPYLAAAMEQQRPAPEEGNEFQRGWWKIGDPPEAFDQMLTSWDMKLKDNERGDFVVGQCWGRVGSDCWLLDQLRGQWNMATTINAICLMYVRWPSARRHLIENTGNGPEVMEALRTPDSDYEVTEDMAGQLGMTEDERARVQAVRRRGLGGLLAVNPKGSKKVRARAVVGYVEAGDVHIRAGAPWVPTFIDELSAFDNGMHDDQVDAFSQAVSRLHKLGAHKARTYGEDLRNTRAST